MSSSDAAEDTPILKARQVQSVAGRGGRPGSSMQAFYEDSEKALRKFLPVVLPECSKEDIPIRMGRETNRHHRMIGFTVKGMERPHQHLTGGRSLPQND